MILIEKTQVVGLEPTIRGMRNPMNSWVKSDSESCYDKACSECRLFVDAHCTHKTPGCNFTIGPNDLDLMLRLAKAGPVDGKFRRMIVVYVDITAPLYWWKEFDTYKVGTVANSCSTMHMIHAKPFTLDDFSHEHLLGEGCVPDHAEQNSYDVLCLTVESLNFWRGIYVGEITGEMIGKGDKRAWWQMIQLLPSSYNQKRTIMLNYEVLSNIYQHRRNHKLDEWRELCRWIEGLPYSEIITCNSAENAAPETEEELPEIRPYRTYRELLLEPTDMTFDEMRRLSVIKEIPEDVRISCEERIARLSGNVMEIEAEKDRLCNFLNGESDSV